jgi:hypothetical protein
MRCREGTLVRPSFDDCAHAVDVTLNKVSGIPPKPQRTSRHPSRGTTWGRDGDATTRTGSDHKYDNEYEADGYGIRELIRLPLMTTTNVTGEGGRVPGGARPGPPPARKQQRLPPSYLDVPPTSPRARVVLVTS